MKSLLLIFSFVFSVNCFGGLPTSNSNQLTGEREYELVLSDHSNIQADIIPIIKTEGEDIPNFVTVYLPRILLGVLIFIVIIFLFAFFL